MICPEKFEIIELLFVCENDGILGENVFLCPENFFVTFPPPPFIPLLAHNFHVF
jgi:hypothetical protein